MDRIPNVVASPLLAAVTWQKSHHSNPSGECVEMAALPSTRVAIRNSRFPDGPALICTKAEVGAFIEAVKNGEFDRLVALPAETLNCALRPPSGRVRQLYRAEPNYFPKAPAHGTLTRSGSSTGE